jgi:hypothetical protein
MGIYSLFAARRKKEGKIASFRSAPFRNFFGTDRPFCAA